MTPVLALTRCTVPPDAAASFQANASDVLAALAVRPGFVRGRIARAAERPDQWVLASEWADMGSYRRGLSAYDVKVALAPVMGYIRDEPGVFEVVVGREGG